MPVTDRTPIELRLTEVHKRLVEIAHSADRIVQKVKGPRPESTGGQVGNIGHCLNNTIDDIFPVVNRIESDLAELHAEFGYDNQPKSGRGLVGGDANYPQYPMATPTGR